LASFNALSSISTVDLFVTPHYSGKCGATRASEKDLREKRYLAVRR
jgi:hypothetical protein